MSRLATALVLIITASGCTPIGRASHPDQLLQQYVERIEQGEIDAAYNLLSERQRQRISHEEFRQRAQQYSEELEAQSRELRRQMSEPIPVTAEVHLETGEIATLTLQEGRWRIAEGAANAVSLASPLQTVRALRRALQRRSYFGVLRVLGREARSQVEDEVARIVEGLDDEESFTVEITGNRARINYDGEHFIDLEREDGEWVIVDMD